MTADIQKLYDDRTALFKQWRDQRLALQQAYDNSSMPQPPLVAGLRAIAAQIVDIEVALAQARAGPP
jgi:hypothetical protein